MRQRLLALTVDTAINALRLIDDQDRAGLPDQVDGALTARFLAGPVHLVLRLLAALGLVRLFRLCSRFVAKLVDGPDRDDHDLNVRAGRKVAHLPELVGIVLKELVTLGAGIQPLEMLAGDL